MPALESIEEVIVYNVAPYREIDCIVRFFSKQRGRSSGFAFGGLRSKRRFLGCLEKLNYITLTLQDYRGYTCLKEARLNKRFSNIHKNPQKLGIAFNCFKFIESVHKGPVDTHKVFSLLLELLNTLENTTEVPFYFPLFFKARLCAEYGYKPTFDVCFDCMKDLKGSGGIFFLEERKLRCKRCSEKRQGGFFLSSYMLEKLQLIFSSSPNNWLAIKIKNFEKNRILPFLDRFVDRTLGFFYRKKVI